MKFLVVTHVEHKKQGGAYYAYAPYVREMNLWFRHVDQVIVIAPLSTGDPGAIDQAYEHDRITFRSVPAFQLTNLKSALQVFWKVPICLWRIFSAMREADHIHLRCPGNMGLLGVIMQIVFPSKLKTVKYAGEWPDYSKEPLSYRLQKKISKSTFLSKQLKVLIYGEWPDFTSNCLAFFTASYTDSDAQSAVPDKHLERNPIKIVFAGTLDERKRPEYTIETVALLREKGYDTEADIIGEGPHRQICERLMQSHDLVDHVRLHGNIPPRSLIAYFQNAHLLVFLSRMEGWPKVVAEAMFWGCVPITTAISCVPWMLGHGERGVIVERSAEAAAKAIEELLVTPEKYITLKNAAMQWSRQYTLEKFDEAIQQLLKPNHG